MPLPSRLSSVMLFSRSEASGIPQKSVMSGCSSTDLARVSAASPVIPFQPTLRHSRRQVFMGDFDAYRVSVDLGLQRTPA